MQVSNLSAFQCAPRAGVDTPGKHIRMYPRVPVTDSCTRAGASWSIPRLERVVPGSELPSPLFARAMLQGLLSALPSSAARVGTRPRVPYSHPETRPTRTESGRSRVVGVMTARSRAHRLSGRICGRWRRTDGGRGVGVRLSVGRTDPSPSDPLCNTTRKFFIRVLIPASIFSPYRSVRDQRFDGLTAVRRKGTEKNRIITTSFVTNFRACFT